MSSSASTGLNLKPSPSPSPCGAEAHGTLWLGWVHRADERYPSLHSTTGVVQLGISASHTHDGVSDRLAMKRRRGFLYSVFKTITIADSSLLAFGDETFSLFRARCAGIPSIFFSSTPSIRPGSSLPPASLSRQRCQTPVFLTRFDARDITTNADVQSRGLPTYYGSGRRRREGVNPPRACLPAHGPVSGMDLESDVVQPAATYAVDHVIPRVAPSDRGSRSSCVFLFSRARAQSRLTGRSASD